jgi:hypothetical protein
MTKTIRGAIIDMEGSVNEARHLADALALAIAGQNKLAISEEDQHVAIEVLADAVRDAAKKVADEWCALWELSGKGETEAISGRPTERHLPA